MGLLASALGREKSLEVVLAAAQALALDDRSFSPGEVRALFVFVGKTRGLVGVVASVVSSRGDVERLIEATAGSAVASSVTTSAAASPAPPNEVTDANEVTPPGEHVPHSPAPNAPVVETVDVVALLAAPLGHAQARAALETVRGVVTPAVPSAWTRDEALAVLEELVRRGGMVGVVAKVVRKKLATS